MKYISVFFIIFIFIFNSYASSAQDSLTVKQQLDRIMEEIKDLNKAVFNKSFEKNNNYSNEKENDTERFTSIDIRIYDLEKDIKNLTLQFEEILFRLDDITNEINNIETELILKIKNNIINSENKINNKEDFAEVEVEEVKEDNTLGKLVISENNQSINNADSQNLDDENKKQKKELNKLSPEEQLQFALSQMMKKNYNESKKILENFILNFPENQLSGSAHFWLGKIYLFESNYRKAAILFGEGVQKFPKSIKAAEMYYELAKSLREMDKIPEACKTLSLLEKNHRGNKFAKDPEKIKVKLNCENQN